MQPKSVMDAVMGGGVAPAEPATAEQPTPEARQKIAALAQRFAELQDGKSFADLMQAVGLGTAGAGVAVGSPLIAGVGSGMVMAGNSASTGFDNRKAQAMNEMDDARAPYPGTYRTPF